MKRVVVTGMGVSLSGWQRYRFLLEEPDGGQKRHRHDYPFDAAEQKVKVAARSRTSTRCSTLKNPRCERWTCLLSTRWRLRPRQCRTAALESGGTSSRSALASMSAAGVGGINTFPTSASSFFESGRAMSRRFLIPMMIGNIAAGNIAINYDAEGPTLPRCDRLRHLHQRRRRGIPRGPLRLC